MNTCVKNDSLTVVDNCSLLLPADWLTTPGSCRLRIKNFNPADWTAGGICASCTVGAGTTWDGTFPVFTPGPNPLYQIAVTTGNIGGRVPLFGSNCACGVLNPFGWYVALSCNGAPPQYIWASGFNALAGGPIGVYTRNQGCVLGANFEIEAYTP